MTGFGRGQADNAAVSATVELKSINSRYIEVSVKLPRHYFEQELIVRNAINQRLQRGKVSAVITVVPKQAPTSSGGRLVDLAYAERLLGELQPLTDDGLATVPDLGALLQIPGILIEGAEAVSEAEWGAVQTALAEALDAIVASRRTEGAALEADLRARIAAIAALAERVPAFEAERTELVKQRLAANLAEWTGGSVQADDRFQQELIYYLERNDITEERVRLAAHLKLFLTTLDAKESQGRKLGFVAQEIGREINTLGAKAYHSGLQSLVIEMKDELEKIKEQLNNLL